jgi:polysaccharide pyruvyl transferase WcaK-like protein
MGFNPVDKAQRLAGLVSRAAPIKAMTSGKPVVTYLGAAAAINIGDVALFDAIRGLLPGLHLVPNAPTSTLSHPLFHRVVEPTANLMLRGGRPARAVMLGGGTLLNDVYFQGMLRRYAQQGLPLCLFGTGVESIEMHGDRLDQVADVLKDGALISVRDPHAQRALANHGVDAPVIGDPAVALCKPVIRESLAERPRVGVNVGSNRHGLLAPQEQITDAVADTVQKLVDKGWEPRFFAMHEYDRQELVGLAERFGYGPESVWYKPQDWQSLLDEMAEMQLIVSQRMHGVILGTGCGCPSISIAYRPKCLHYMESIGMEAQCFRADTVDHASLWAGVEDVLNQYPQMSRAAAEGTSKLRESLADFAQRVTDLLTGSTPAPPATEGATP